MIKDRLATSILELETSCKHAFVECVTQVNLDNASLMRVMKEIIRVQDRELKSLQNTLATLKRFDTESSRSNELKTLNLSLEKLLLSLEAKERALSEKKNEADDIDDVYNEMGIEVTDLTSSFDLLHQQHNIMRKQLVSNCESITYNHLHADGILQSIGRCRCWKSSSSGEVFYECE